MDYGGYFTRRWRGTSAPSILTESSFPVPGIPGCKTADIAMHVSTPLEGIIPRWDTWQWAIVTATVLLMGTGTGKASTASEASPPLLCERERGFHLRVAGSDRWEIGLLIESAVHRPALTI